MTTEDIFRNELLARKTRLQEQIKELTAQLNAVKTMLAASAPGPDAATPEIPSALPPALRIETPPPLATLAPPPPAPEPAAPVAPVIPPVPDDRSVKKTRKRGWIMARIEQLINEGGPTFSYHTILPAYRNKWGLKNYPTKNVIGATLWKVVRKRGHPVVRQGSGRRSTVYQKEIP